MRFIAEQFSKIFTKIITHSQFSMMILFFKFWHIYSSLIFPYPWPIVCLCLLGCNDIVLVISYIPSIRLSWQCRCVQTDKLSFNKLSIVLTDQRHPSTTFPTNAEPNTSKETVNCDFSLLIKILNFNIFHIFLAHLKQPSNQPTNQHISPLFYSAIYYWHFCCVLSVILSPICGTQQGMVEQQRSLWYLLCSALFSLLFHFATLANKKDDNNKDEDNQQRRRRFYGILEAIVVSIFMMLLVFGDVPKCEAVGVQ